MGTGENIKIKEDRWLKYGIIGGPANQNDPKRVTDLINKEEMKWDKQTIRHFFEDNLADEILAVPLNPQKTSDKIVWRATKTGEFSIKSAYNML